MPRFDDDSPDWSDEGDDWDDDFDTDDDFEGEDDDDEPTIACPYCGAEIHEDSPRCPSCGEYISAEDAPPARRPWWIVLGVVICLFLVYLWTTGGR